MAALTGQMMQMPLMISSLIVHAARHAAQTEIVSKRVEGDIHRYTWADAEKRSRQVAQALARMGCTAGDRVGTLVASASTSRSCRWSGNWRRSCRA